MVIGYWDGNGFDALITGDASSQTFEVEQAIASDGHYEDYSLPTDDPNTGLLPDRSYYGGAHASNCVGDFMRTSWYTADNYYGWSWFSDVDNSLCGYVDWVNGSAGVDYDRDSWNEYWGSFTWGDFVAEIDAGRPLVLLVDTDGNGWTDHFVTAIGYRDVNGYEEYACLDTWAPPGYIRWERFRGIASGIPWGIYGATHFWISGAGFPDCNANGVPDDEDIANGTSQDCNANGIPDECDIADGTSADVNGNGIPDECEPFAAPMFRPVGDLPGGDVFSTALAVSADGSTVVGFSRSSNGNEAFRWTAIEEIVGLGDLPGGSFASCAHAVSADGSVVVGVGDGWAPSVAFRWTTQEGMVPLGILFGGNFESCASAVSADGYVIVGSANSASGDEAFRWTPGDGMVGLGDLPGGAFHSEAHGVSADGTIIVGTGSVVSTLSDWAFRWTYAEGMLPLWPESYQGEDIASFGRAVSGDGATVVGALVVDAAGNAVFPVCWTEATGFHYLRDAGADTDGIANAASEDGGVIVGTDSALGAFVWDEVHGARSLQDVLEQHYGLGLTGWTLTAATGISGNGQVIVGTGTDPDGFTAGWVVSLPCVGDLNGDGMVDLADLAQLLGHYGLTGGAIFADGDLDTDEDVDLADLAALLGVYGTTCP